MRMFIIAGILLSAVVTSGAENIVSLRMSHNVGTAPLTVTATVSFDEHPENRKLCLTFDGDGEYLNSCVDIATDQRIWSGRRKVGAGEYVVQATIVRVHDGKPSYHIAQTHLSVTEPGTPIVR